MKILTALLLFILVVSSLAEAQEAFNPYLFETEAGTVDFANGQVMTYRYEFAQGSTQSIGVAYEHLEPGTTMDEAFDGDCYSHWDRSKPFNSVGFTNFQVVDGALRFDIVVAFHSGSCKDMALPSGEPIRYFLEGEYWNPKTTLREGRLVEIVGQIIWINDIPFEIVEIVHFTRADLEAKYAADVERYGHAKYTDFAEFFELDGDGRDLFLYFCASDGPNNDQWFEGRYVVLLEPAVVGED